jgi:hypothetical protein
MQPIHILTKLGVLASFSIAKKVTEEDINKFFEKYRKLGKDKEQIGELLKEAIFLEIQEALDNQKIPGLIIPTVSAAKDKFLSSMVDLNKFIISISKVLKDKKYDKMAMCYFINSMVNIFELTEKDFEKFHKKMSHLNNDLSSEDEDDE